MTFAHRYGGNSLNLIIITMMMMMMMMMYIFKAPTPRLKVQDKHNNYT